jgi:hypothetical protein
MDNQRARFDTGGALKRVADLPATGLVSEEELDRSVITESALCEFRNLPLRRDSPRVLHLK